MTVSRTICLGFLAMITIGTLLLMLPFALSDGSWNSLLTAGFTATSAVCVTGLIVEDTGSYYSGFGQLLILLLIQIGGLGYMTVNTFLLLLLGRRFGLREKLAIQKSLDASGLSGAVQLVQSIVAVTLLFELTGSLILWPTFAADYGTARGLWLAVFHSISAFNNAGFSLFSDSLMQYSTSVPVNLVVPVLVLVGGIGYQVIMETYAWLRHRLRGSRERQVFSLNFKIVTSTSFALLVLGVLAFLAIDIKDLTIQPETWGDRLLLAWSQAVMPRTAGFNTVDYGTMGTLGLFATMALMIIGGNPSSTAGGIKTTTVRILYECTKAVLQGKEEVLCYQREIPTSLILKAVGVIFGSSVTVLAVTTMITIAEPDLEFVQILFESISAFATVGLSTGITAVLSVSSKLTLIATMYIGRVGVLILMAAILGDPKPSSIHYPEENLLVG